MQNPTQGPPGPPRPPGQPSPRWPGTTVDAPDSPESVAPPDIPSNSGETSSKLAATDWAPVPKVAAASATVPFAGLVLWIAGELGLDMPVYVAGDVAILLALVVAYLTPER